MSGKVKLKVIQGPMGGQEFVFEEHDTFLFGRMADCHVHLPGDSAVSRHHFILEANPPDARVRDLGSLNGTCVNGVKHGGRRRGETPQEGAKRAYPQVDLKHGDRIQVGHCVLAVEIEAPAVCNECAELVPDAERAACALADGSFVCTECRRKAQLRHEQPAATRSVCCQKCGRDVSSEVGAVRRGDYVCEACRAVAGQDPGDLLLRLLAQALTARRTAEQMPAISGYVMQKKIGAGGFGAVYAARRKADGLPVAVKVMLSKVAVDEHSRRSFLREIDVMRNLLHHENIVQILDYGSLGSTFYFVMEMCEGGSVDGLALRRGGKLTPSQAAPIMLQSLQGLAYAHERGYVHRDLKPPNILLQGSEGRGVAKVSDYGLAKNFQKAGFSGMTVTGSSVGTPLFMPREQVTNFKYVQPASDVWSMGATFYHMLTGQLPRDHGKGRDPLEVILAGSIVPIRQRDSTIPKPLAEVMDRALAADPAARYQDGGQMLKALRKAL